MEKAFAAVRGQAERLKDTYERYERFVPAASFFAGILLDIFTVGRIDQWSNIVTLGVYLIVAMVFLGLEAVDVQTPLIVPEKIQRFWKYREEVAHFIYGSLLSAFAIFYFKSSSFWGALSFYVVIAACLVGNEFSAIRRAGLALRSGLLALCLASYFACVTPVFWGEVGWVPFLLGVSAAGLALFGFAAGIARLVPDKMIVTRRVGYPFAGVVAGLVLFYFLRLIPPVPLSLTMIGIYRSVDRVPGGYALTSVKPAWRFWHTGDQDYAWRPGDRVYCFFSVFSPTGFKDQIKVRWIYKHPEKGWQPSDAVPVSITGGRVEGYRGFAYKQNIQPGKWQVRIETRDEREIGRITLWVEKDESTEPRELRGERI